MPLDQTNRPHTTSLGETTTPLVRARNSIQRGCAADAMARDTDGNRLTDARSSYRMVFDRGDRGDGVERFDPSFITAIRRLEVACTPNASLGRSGTVSDPIMRLKSGTARSPVSGG